MEKVQEIHILRRGNSFTSLPNTLSHDMVNFINHTLSYVIDNTQNIFRLRAMLKHAQTEKEALALKTQISNMSQYQRIYLMRGMNVPTGLLNIVKVCLDTQKINYEIQELHRKPGFGSKLKWVVKYLGLRYYQEEAIDECMKAGRGVVEAAMGTGKTLMMADLIRRYRLTTLIVVPSTGLVRQTIDKIQDELRPMSVKHVTNTAVNQDWCLLLMLE